jgi:hypothetical protein
MAVMGDVTPNMVKVRMYGTVYENPVSEILYQIPRNVSLVEKASLSVHTARLVFRSCFGSQVPTNNMGEPDFWVESCWNTSYERSTK